LFTIPQKFIYTILYAIIIAAVLFVIEITYRRYKLSAEISRKIGHITVGLISLIFIQLINDIYIIGIISSCAFIFLLITREKGFLDSIHSADRKSLGSVIYPLPFLICFVITKIENSTLYLYLPLLTFILADSAAALGGIWLRWIPYKIGKQTKTVSGSIAFFTIAVILAMLIINRFFDIRLLILFGISLIMALLTTLIEAITPKGLDNISITIIQILLIKSIFIIIL